MREREPADGLGNVLERRGTGVSEGLGVRRAPYPDGVEHDEGHGPGRSGPAVSTRACAGPARGGGRTVVVS